MALAVPLSRFTSQVGGGSAFFVRRLRTTNMKHVTSILLIAGTFFAAEIRGQGFVYLSNTNQTINSSDWTADMVEIPFTTGANSTGYLLDSVTVLFASNDIPVLMTAAVFDYRTYSYFLSGAEVGSAGYYTFAPNTTISLAAATPYLMVVFPADPFANLPSWNYITSSAVSSVDNWSTSLTDGAAIPLFAISATSIGPVPEPTAVSLVCLGALVFILFQRRTPPNKSPEPTAVAAAVAIHVASRRWLSFFR